MTSATVQGHAGWRGGGERNFVITLASHKHFHPRDLNTVWTHARSRGSQCQDVPSTPQVHQRVAAHYGMQGNHVIALRSEQVFGVSHPTGVTSGTQVQRVHPRPQVCSEILGSRTG